MIRSMTGFGRGEIRESDNICTIEIKSVNNRFLEIKSRFPKQSVDIEQTVKKKIKENFSRGSFDIFLTMNWNESAAKRLVLDIDLVKQYLDCSETLKKDFNIKGEPDLNSFLNINGLLKIEDIEVDKDYVGGLILSALDNALAAMKEMKEKEGEAILIDLEERLGKVSEWTESINKKLHDINENFREKFKKRLQDALGDIQIDETRLAQEVVLWIDKGDISEELTRIASHLIQIRTALQGQAPVGKKLEFILQEINRETNTIGSKSNDPFISEKVVLIKCELERVREQVLNVE